MASELFKSKSHPRTIALSLIVILSVLKLTLTSYEVNDTDIEWVLFLTILSYGIYVLEKIGRFILAVCIQKDWVDSLIVLNATIELSDQHD